LQKNLCLKPRRRPAEAACHFSKKGGSGRGNGKIIKKTKVLTERKAYGKFGLWGNGDLLGSESRSKKTRREKEPGTR